MTAVLVSGVFLTVLVFAVVFACFKKNNKNTAAVNAGKTYFTVKMYNFINYNIMTSNLTILVMEAHEYIVQRSSCLPRGR